MGFEIAFFVTWLLFLAEDWLDGRGDDGQKAQDSDRGKVITSSSIGVA